MGVDVFFVISGFLITSIIAREMNEGTFSFLNFYARRARRIFPALILMLTAVLIFGWFLLLAAEYKEVGKHVASGAFFVSNLVLLTEAGYFDVSAMFKPLLHLWSLGVEEQFYLVWPCLLLAAAFSRVKLLWGAIAVAAASFLYSAVITPQNLHSAFYLPHSRFWELAVGATLALLPTLPMKHWASVSAAGLVLIAAGIILTREDAFFPAPMAALTVVGSALIIFGGLNAASKPLLANPVAKWIGLISYPLYLWHWPLLSFPSIILSGVPPTWMRVAAVIASVILAAATYYLVERPLRGSKHLALKAVASTLVLFGVGGMGFWIYVNEGIDTRLAVESSQSEFTGPLWEFATNQDCLDRFPIEGKDDYGWWFCSVSSPSPPTVLVLGTSFANALYPGLALNPALTAETVLSFGACDPAFIENAQPNADQFSPCTPVRRQEQQAVIDQIVAADRPKLVVLNGLEREPTPSYIESIAKRIRFFESKGAKVAIHLPHYRVERLLRGCFSRPLLDPIDECTFARGGTDVIKADFEPLVAEISAEFPEVGFFDPTPLYCKAGEQTCSLVIDGRPIFRDEYDHYSQYASERLGDLFVSWLKTWPSNPLRLN